ncbi:hypothetical protein [Azohydromonas aeria]|uniref:hypothetical protein n=1 Tax=Azohydromonas aeria TaxID=2590212 RepID=UPI0012FBF094|nr:hypothetical protein [Azohydromonas aeria]
MDLQPLDLCRITRSAHGNEGVRCVLDWRGEIGGRAFWWCHLAGGNVSEGLAWEADLELVKRGAA